MKRSYRVAGLAILAICGANAAPQDNQVSFVLPSGVRIRIAESAFQRRTFHVVGCEKSGGDCAINGHIPFGFDFTVPKTYVKEIVAEYAGKSHQLDSSDMYDAWGSRPLQYEGKVRYFGGKCFDADNCQFRGLFSDAAGSYVAEWRITNGLSIRAVLTNSDDVVDLFERHIDPPEYE